MADFFESLKKTWIKAIEVVGDTATNLADSAKNKVDEMNLVSNRKDLLFHCGERAYELWLDGKELPTELAELFESIKEFDDKLADITAQRNAAKEEKMNQAQQADMREQDIVQQTKDVLHDTDDLSQGPQHPSSQEEEVANGAPENKEEDLSPAQSDHQEENSNQEE